MVLSKDKDAEGKEGLGEVHVATGVWMYDDGFRHRLQLGSRVVLAVSTLQGALATGKVNLVITFEYLHEKKIQKNCRIE